MDLLIKRRGIIKAQITRIGNYFTQQKSANEDDINERITKLIELYQQFEIVQLEIELHPDCKDEDGKMQDAERTLMEEKYFETKSLASKLIKELTNDNSLSTTINPQTSLSDNTTEMKDAIEVLMRHQVALAELVKQIPTENSIGHDGGMGSRNNGQQSENHSNFQLQRIEIPKFDGNYKNWPEFHDLFKSLVHNQKRLSSCEKLQYLKHALIGNAQGFLKNITISTFNKKEVIIDSHLQTIMEQQKLHTTSAEGLRLLCSNINESVRALKALDLPTEHWDRWLMFLLSTKLDNESLKFWRRECSQRKEDENITFANLVKFINNRIYELTPLKEIKLSSNTSHQKNKVSHISFALSNSCYKCQGEHGVFTCPEFLNLTIKKRREYVKEKGLCFNCLRAKHMVKECVSNSRCKVCKFKHNTLLHEQKGSSQDSSRNSKQEPEQVCTNTANFEDERNTAILPTAIVHIKDTFGQYQKCRILLDTGSQVNLISENCVQRLHLRRKHAKVIINGIGSVRAGKIRGKVHIHLKSMFNDFQISGQAFILANVTCNIPSTRISENAFTGITLADPKYTNPSKIDIVVGSDIFFEVLQTGKIDNGPKTAIAQETKFGWVVSGRGTIANIQNDSFHTCIDISDRLKSFWEIEELNIELPQTNEEKQAEEYFVQTYSRTEDGRYIVRLPFKQDCDVLGTSYNSALLTLKSMEKRFEKNPRLKYEYTKFITEYLELHHMVQVPDEHKNLLENKCFYLPHHAVVKEDSTTTKLRVVFDGSRKTSTGISLNNLLLVGPTIQKDIWSLLLNFRKFKVAYTADIAKMYRQVLVDNQDTPFQRILWRSSCDEQVKEYELQTVTYGTSSAPFAAIRVLKQLALDEGDNYKLGAENLINNFYVDDFMGGSHSLQNALEVKQQLTTLLYKGGFDLRKWSSNSIEFLTTVDKEHREVSVSLPLQEDASVKILGLRWHPVLDCFTFEVKLDPSENFSKRTILSEISKIYDPLGLLSPCVVIGKLIMQQIWILGITWDDRLPDTLIQNYKEFRSELFSLSSLKIPRYLNITENSSLQLCGFADASESAYAAVIYLRAVTNQQVSVKLLVSKTRVSPIKQISLPRLELCAAVLLANLITKVKSTMNIQNLELYAFTDSTVVLAWLKATPRKWKTFIANRASQILEVLPYNNWRHVRSANNAADPASRGVAANKLIGLDLWWNGPQFLYTEDFNKNTIMLENLNTNLEQRMEINLCALNVNNTDVNQDIFQRYSSLEKLVAVVARCQRFVFNVRASQRGLRRKIDINLSVSELQSARKQLIILAQIKDFKLEINLLNKDKPVKKDSKLFALLPFIDSEGVLRVGGRIQEAQVSYNKKHPIILFKSHHLTKLLIQDIHNKYFHANTQLMMNVLHMRYWVIGGRHAVKKCINECVICQRYRAKGFNQQMGNLPSYRIQPCRPFTNTGTDFTGPFQVKAWNGRASKQLKCYVAIFICMSTKAVHIELVSDLSTDMFLAALHRFTSRRGICANIYSDNGKNYVGAARKLSEMQRFLQQYNNIIAKQLSRDEIQWHFIPAYSPNFGGLWESAVKSLKFHLKRVINDRLLTYEEMNTLLCQVEACLNSRPITSNTFDCGDIEPLTPGHFLTQGPIQMPPSENTEDNFTTATRWRLVQQMHNAFWKRWSAEYISTLQRRKKWAEQTKNLQINDLVLIKEDNMPPCKWLMGKVVSTKPGRDNLVRVVTLKTKKGLIDRSIRKLIVFLPAE